MNRIFTKFISIFALIIMLARASDVVLENETDSFYITPHYFNGSYLIYDCRKGHFACVSEFNFKECQQYSKVDIAEENNYLRCIPFKVFELKKECLVKLIDLTNNSFYVSSCINDPVKKYFKFY